jgi:D-alanyl-lipoteichoic acid acyltransferase DltB (MBOAT superfamily)
VGLFKKVLVADQLAPYVDRVFADPQAVGAGPLLMAVYAYAIQIYCDFSGYTDISRGSAYCLGLELPENFRAPYFAFNITDFWRCWHITLSFWLRDYLYIPLGGNRLGQWKTYRNLMITMALGGLWHGANWTFVIWGALHGLALCVTRLVHQWRGVPPDRPLFGGRVYRALSVVCTFHFVCLAWIFFRAPTLADALAYCRGLLSHPLLTPTDLARFGRVELALIAVQIFTVALLHAWAARSRNWTLCPSVAWDVARPWVSFAIAVGVILCAARGPAQFIYFQF